MLKLLKKLFKQKKLTIGVDLENKFGTKEKQVDLCKK